MKMSTARRSRITGSAVVLAGATALTVAGLAVPAGAAAHSPAARASAHKLDPNFFFTGGEQLTTVPSGVNSATITAIGAAGEDLGLLGGDGGDGAVAVGTFSVSPGEVLHVFVGGIGGPIQGGFNGGGLGSGTAGDGGGASDVRVGGNALANRIIVAGGGGGGGLDGSCSPSGGDGGFANANGIAGSVCSATGTGGGGGGAGSPVANGGTAGTGNVAGTAGGTGVLGIGGNGGAGAAGGTNGDGGGGGGGLFGGGGGGGGGLDNVTPATHGGGGGGGGSSLGSFLGNSTAPAQVDISYSSATALSITTSSPLPGATRNHSYSTTLHATGGTPGYTWSLVSGSLPAGLSLSSGGVISGTPTTNGTKTFTVQVRDSVGNTATKQFSLTVSGTPSDLSILLSHDGFLRHDRVATYEVEVANTSGSATSVETHVTVQWPGSVWVRQGGAGTFWQCHKKDHSTFCARNAKIKAHDSTSISMKVMIRTAVGKHVKAKATVSPSDSTAGDNVDIDIGLVRKHG